MTRRRADHLFTGQQFDSVRQRCSSTHLITTTPATISRFGCNTLQPCGMFLRLCAKRILPFFPRVFDYQDNGPSTRAHRNRADRCLHRYQLLGIDFDVFDFQTFPGVRSVNAAIPCLNHARIRILPGRFGLQLSDTFPHPTILRPRQCQRESKLIRV